MQQTLINGEVMVLHHAPCSCEPRTRPSFERILHSQTCGKHRSKRSRSRPGAVNSGIVLHIPLPAYHPPLSKHTPLKEQCTIALHFSLPANAYLRRCRRRRLDRERISSPAPTAVMEFLFPPAAATRSGVAFAFFTSSPPSPFVLLASNHLPDHALPTLPNTTQSHQPSSS